MCRSSGAPSQTGAGASPRDSDAEGDHGNDESSDYLGEHISLQKVHIEVYRVLLLHRNRRRLTERSRIALPAGALQFTRA